MFVLWSAAFILYGRSEKTRFPYQKNPVFESKKPGFLTRRVKDKNNSLWIGNKKHKDKHGKRRICCSFRGLPLPLAANGKPYSYKNRGKLPFRGRFTAIEESLLRDWVCRKPCPYFIIFILSKGLWLWLTVLVMKLSPPWLSIVNSSEEVVVITVLPSMV